MLLRSILKFVCNLRKLMIGRGMLLRRKSMDMDMRLKRVNVGNFMNKLAAAISYRYGRVRFQNRFKVIFRFNDFLFYFKTNIFQ